LCQAFWTIFGRIVETGGPVSKLEALKQPRARGLEVLFGGGARKGVPLTVLPYRFMIKV
jgi:hypothetical protein